MSIKGLGAVLIIAGCGGFGFSLAAGVRQQETLLQQLVRVLGLLEAELQYRLTTLPELCKMAAGECDGSLRRIFRELSTALTRQDQPDATVCMDIVLQYREEIPTRVRKHLRHLGRSLGRFDLQGQLRGIQTVRNACEGDLALLRKDRDVRLRSYQTLSLCAGTALVILFV